MESYGTQGSQGKSAPMRLETRDHQSVAALETAAAHAAASRTGIEIFARNQRSRVTDCGRTVRCVPDFRSCEKRGPPRTGPRTTGSSGSTLSKPRNGGRRSRGGGA